MMKNFDLGSMMGMLKNFDFGSIMGGRPFNLEAILDLKDTAWEYLENKGVPGNTAFDCLL